MISWRGSEGKKKGWRGKRGVGIAAFAGSADGRIRATHSVFGVNERVVNGNDLDVGVLNGIAEDDTSNAAEAVDADLYGSHCELICAYALVSQQGFRSY
jgi:hypothetical protein